VCVSWAGCGDIQPTLCLRTGRGRTRCGAETRSAALYEHRSARVCVCLDCGADAVCVVHASMGFSRCVSTRRRPLFRLRGPRAPDGPGPASARGNVSSSFGAPAVGRARSPSCGHLLRCFLLVSSMHDDGHDELAPLPDAHASWADEFGRHCVQRRARVRTSVH
jgi:hypothetical protein